MTSEIAAELGELLAKARILMFEYDADGFLLSALGSCVGAQDPEIEVRAGLVSAGVVRRAAAGERVVERTRVAGHDVAVVHEPVRGERGRVERILATAFALDGAAASARVDRRLAALLS